MAFPRGGARLLVRPSPETHRMLAPTARPSHHCCSVLLLICIPSIVRVGGYGQSIQVLPGPTWSYLGGQEAWLPMAPVAFNHQTCPSLPRQLIPQFSSTGWRGSRSACPALSKGLCGSGSRGQRASFQPGRDSLRSGSWTWCSAEETAWQKHGGMRGQYSGMCREGTAGQTTLVRSLDSHL